jgi:hypothetical protein
MSEIFIPPEGAHQFQFIKGPLPGGMRRDMGSGRLPRRPEWIWVGAPVPNQGRCKCKMAYPVLIEGLPEDLRKVAKKIMKAETGYPVECACRGKIIE